MGLLEELLKYSKEQSQAVIVILIGLIVVGSIGGLLRIQTLNSNLSNSEKVQKERIGVLNDKISVLKERMKSHEDSYTSEIKELKEKVDQLEISFSAVKDSIGLIVNEIENIRSLTGMPSNIKDMLIEKWDGVTTVTLFGDFYTDLGPRSRHPAYNDQIMFSAEEVDGIWYVKP